MIKYESKYKKLFDNVGYCYELLRGFDFYYCREILETLHGEGGEMCVNEI